MRTLAVTTLIIGTLAALPAAEPTRPLAPTVVNVGAAEKTQPVLGAVAAELSKQSGVPIQVAPALLKAKCDVQFTKLPFWEALQTAADKSGARIALQDDGGQRIELVPRGKSRDVATTSGSFRVVAQGVVGRARLDQGITFHEVSLLVHWEPRIRVYRIDRTPKISKVTDVPGSDVQAQFVERPDLPLASAIEMSLRLDGLTRDSEKITTLAGVFTATGTEKILTFSFAAPGGKLPADKKDSGVTASLKQLQKKDDTWEIAIEVNYPPGQPEFKSHQGEWWLRDNKLTVRSPDGKSFVIDDYEIPTPDRAYPLRVIHRFKEDPAKGLGDPTKPGWTLVYETPGPMVEMKVPFELKDIPLL